MILLNEMKKLLSEFEIETITETNYKQLADIYHTNDAFFLLTEGKKGSVESCLADIESVPPGFDIDSKYFTSFWLNGQPVAVMDVLIGYPSSGVIWIGFLLVHNEWKGKHIGRKIVEALFTAAGVLGLNEIQLGVVKKNVNGLVFWRKMGFEKLKDATAKINNGEELDIVVMGKYI